MKNYLRIAPRMAPLALVTCAPAVDPPAPPLASGAAPAPPSSSASIVAPPAEVRVDVEGECRASARTDCFTSADGFRALHPRPLAATLRDVAVLPGGEVWIVGDGATLIRVERAADDKSVELSRITIPDAPTFEDTVKKLDGSSYEPEAWPGASLLKADFDAISAAGPKDVWIAIGGGDAAHWNGERWHLEELPAMGGAGDALMRDERGRTWMSGALGAGLITGEQRPLVFEIVGGKPTSTKAPTIPGKKRIRALARQGDEVWAAGFDGALFVSRGGEAFEPVAPPAESWEDFWDLWLDPEGTAGFLLGHDLYAKEGSRFGAKIPVKGSAYDLWASAGAKSVWVVGDWAYRVKEGATEKVPIDGYRAGTDSIVSLAEGRFEGIDGRADDDVWMVGACGGIYRFDGDTLSELFPRETDDEIAGIEWTGERTFMAATGDGKLLHGSLDDDGLTVETSPMSDLYTLRKLASGDLIAAHCRDVQVRSASGWTKLPEPPGCVKQVAGLGPDDFWAIGSSDLVDGFVWRFQKGRWARVRKGDDKGLYDVAVASDGTVWIGGDGVLLRAKGGPLQVVARHDHDEYRALAVSGPNEVWIAGDSNEIGSAGMIARFDGKKLERFERVAANFLDAISLGTNGEIFAAGLGGVAARWDGSKFVPIATGTDQSLQRLLFHPSGVLLAAGRCGAILRRDPSP